MHDRVACRAPAFGKLRQSLLQALFDSGCYLLGLVAFDHDADVVGARLPEQFMPHAGFSKNFLVGRRSHHDRDALDVVGLAEIP